MTNNSVIFSLHLLFFATVDTDYIFSRSWKQLHSLGKVVFFARIQIDTSLSFAIGNQRHVPFAKRSPPRDTVCNWKQQILEIQHVLLPSSSFDDIAIPLLMRAVDAIQLLLA